MRGPGYLLRGLGLWRTRPGLMLLGMVPALLVLLLVAGTLVVLLLQVGDLVAWATPFADDWATALRAVVRTGLALLLVVGFLVVASMTFTALALTLGDPFYARIWAETEQMLGGDVPDSGPGFWRSAADGLVLAGTGLLLGVGVLVLGLLPVVGTVVGLVLGVVVSGRLLAAELVSRALEARGLDRAARAEVLGRDRGAVLGFGVVTQLCFLVPLGAVAVMPAAVAGATMLARDLLHLPPRVGQRGPWTALSHTSRHSVSAARTACSAGEAAIDRRWTATTSRVGTGSAAATVVSGGSMRGRPRRGTSAMPSPARTRARWESYSRDSCAICGLRPVPTYIRCSHWRQMVPSGVAIQPSSTRSAGVTRPRPATGWSSRTTTSATSRATTVRSRWSGTCRGTSPQECTTPMSRRPAATVSTVSQGSVSVREKVRSG